MFTGKFFITTIAIAVAITFIQWFFIGFLFHKYQALTPATWRKETSRSYLASMFISLFFSFMFVLLFSLWKENCDGSINMLDGITFGVIFWLTFSVTAELGNAVYVNYSRMFVMGKCVSSLFEYIVAGGLAAVIL